MLRLLVASGSLCAAGALSLWQEAQQAVEGTSDACAHIVYDDVAFMAPYLLAEGIDATPDGWAYERQRVLNYDERSCVPQDAPYAATGFASARGRRKVFGVGLSKTGTTSLHNALLQIGFMNSDMADGFWDAVVDGASPAEVAAFWGEDADEDARRRTAVAARTKKLFASRSGATDLPSASFVDELLAAFPDALFVLTTRNLDDWGRSAFQQFSRPPRGDVIGRNRLSAFGAQAFDPHLYRKRFLEHYARTLRLVPCCQLLLLDVMRGEGWGRLGPFLHLEPRKTPSGAFPWINPGIASNGANPDLRKRRTKADDLFDKGDGDADGFLTMSELAALLETVPPPVMPRVSYDNWTMPLIRRHWDKAYAGLAESRRDPRGMDKATFFKYCMRLNLVGGIDVEGARRRRRRADRQGAGVK